MAGSGPERLEARVEASVARINSRNSSTRRRFRGATAGSDPGRTGGEGGGQCCADQQHDVVESEGRRLDPIRERLRGGGGGRRCVDLLPEQVALGGKWRRRMA
jgi:hypothetical protein